MSGEEERNLKRKLGDIRGHLVIEDKPRRHHGRPRPRPRYTPPADDEPLFQRALPLQQPNLGHYGVQGVQPAMVAAPRDALSELPNGLFMEILDELTVGEYRVLCGEMPEKCKSAIGSTNRTTTVDVEFYHWVLGESGETYDNWDPVEIGIDVKWSTLEELQAKVEAIQRYFDENSGFTPYQGPLWDRGAGRPTVESDFTWLFDVRVTIQYANSSDLEEDDNDDDFNSSDVKPPDDAFTDLEDFVFSATWDYSPDLWADVLQQELDVLLSARRRTAQERVAAINDMMRDRGLPQDIINYIRGLSEIQQVNRNLFF